jgi:hypothetical protein
MLASAGAAPLIPALAAIPALGPILAAGGVLADLVGGLFQNPQTARSNQISNLLGMSQYLHPATLNMTTAAGTGNLVSENAYGATDTGIAASSIRVSPSMLAVEGQSPWYSLSNKPTLGFEYQPITANAANYGMFGNPSTGQAYSYSQVPGQVLYNQLPANSTPAPMSVNLSVNAIDSQSILDRSSDIAAAVVKELYLGSGIAQTLQNSIFGPS